MKQLSLPPTIRTARPDEVPKGEDVLRRIEESKSANIVEGFRFYYNEEREFPFKFLPK